MQEFAANVKYLRRKHNLTQQQLAWVVGVDNTLVSHWESGKRSPTAKGLKEVAILFGVDMQTLMDISIEDKEKHSDEN